MKCLICLSCFLLAAGCGKTPAPETAIPAPEHASQPDALASTPKNETKTAASRIDEATKMLVGNWEGQSDQVRLRMELGTDQTIIETADSGAGLKSVNEGTWKVIEVQGDSITLEIEPKGKPSYHQTDVFDGRDMFSHKHDGKVIQFVRQ